MKRHYTTLTTSGIEKLQLKINQLKERYEHITQDLRDKTQGHTISSIKLIEKDIIFSDIVKLQATLLNVKVLEQTDNPVSAEQGTKVTYRQDDKDIEYTVTLVDPLEADPLEGFVSIASPVGSALLGRQINDTLTIATPKGSHTFTITQLG